MKLKITDHAMFEMASLKRQHEGIGTIVSKLKNFSPDQAHPFDLTDQGAVYIVESGKLRAIVFVPHQTIGSESEGVILNVYNEDQQTASPTSLPQIVSPNLMV
jgi:hypothetical protein